MSPRLTFDQTIGEVCDELEDVLLELRRVNRDDLRSEQINDVSYRITRINDEWARIMARRSASDTPVPRETDAARRAWHDMDADHVTTFERCPSAICRGAMPIPRTRDI